MMECFVQTCGFLRSWRNIRVAEDSRSGRGGVTIPTENAIFGQERQCRGWKGGKAGPGI